MNFKNSIIAWFLLTLYSLPGLAGVKVTNLDLKLQESQGIIIASVLGNSLDLPDVRVNQNVIEIEMLNSDGFNLINKNVNGAKLSAYNLNNKAVIKAVLPYHVSQDTVQINYRNNSLEISFPRNKKTIVSNTQLSKVLHTPSLIASTQTDLSNIVEKNVVLKEELDEKYLNKLIKEDQKKTNTKESLVRIDEVSTKMSSNLNGSNQTKPQDSKEFSFSGYVFKFSIFLLFVLGLFYGIVQVMKKGFLSRGKLSFLNDSKLIEVLNTSYIAPKKSLLLVKVHKQIFLISNTDNGLNFMTEISDTSGLIKETEKLVAGDNFDEKMGLAEDQDNLNIKLKENILESTPESSQINTLKQDVVKFSDELKKKAKKLRPIENRVN